MKNMTIEELIQRYRVIWTDLNNHGEIEAAAAYESVINDLTAILEGSIPRRFADPMRKY